ncbi:unnamed protein product [Cylindrotheca closterium]|uniref:Uncharacterized protein n=1 Tax=Cylindrotheca closterium TaxID=2856 RepID=A0AAD2JHE8_9STRA|nr:unnamed protein product [Cylindrotheca closterium]
MVSSTTTNKKKTPPRLSAEDYMIRSKALDLLQTVDHQIVYENDYDDDDGDNSDFSWITPEEQPISYQHSSAVPVIERKQQQRHPARIMGASQDQWIDIFVPAVSCISNACKLGVSSMVKQTKDGFHVIQNDLRERRLDRANVKKKKDPSSHRPQRNIRRNDSFHRQRAGYPEILETRRGTAGQQTAERYSARGYVEDEDILCYHPGEWRPQGLLFVPGEDLRQHQYDDVSLMTAEDHNDSTKKCLGFCPVV